MKRSRFMRLGLGLALVALMNLQSPVYADTASGGHETDRVSVYNGGAVYFRSLMKLPLPDISGGTPTAATLHVSFTDPIIIGSISVSVYIGTDLTWTSASSAATLEAVETGASLGTWTVEDSGIQSLDVSTSIIAAYGAAATEVPVILTISGTTATTVDSTMFLGSGGNIWTLDSNVSYLSVTYTPAEARIPVHSGLGGGALMF